MTQEWRYLLKLLTNIILDHRAGETFYLRFLTVMHVHCSLRLIQYILMFKSSTISTYLFKDTLLYPG